MKFADEHSYNGQLNFGFLTCECEHCGAKFWKEEKTGKNKRTKTVQFSLCCNNGRVKLPLLKPAPRFLERLLSTSKDQNAMNFHKHIRKYNAMFTMTSIGGRIDNEINKKTWIIRI